MKLKSATKEEFDAFLAAYPRKLYSSVLTIVQPERMQFYDDTLGIWPEFVVASYWLWGADDNDIWAQVPGKWMIADTTPNQPTNEEPPA